MSHHVMIVEGKPVLEFFTDSDLPVSFSNDGAEHYAYQDGMVVGYWRRCR